MKERKKPGPKPDPNSKRSRGEDRHKEPRVVLHVPRPLLALIDRDSDAEDRTRTAHMLRILKQHYAAKGEWPPAGNEG